MARAQEDGGTGPRGALSAFRDRRTLVMLGLGFASGLPNLMIFDTLSAWLRDAGLPLKVISIFSLATLAYSVKFLWAPLLERTRPPLLGAWLGRRRGWMAATQLAAGLGLALIAAGGPGVGLGRLGLLAALTGFVSATQDVVIDAWRIEAAPASAQGVMAAAYQWGYRTAIIVAGALPLFLADRLGWRAAFGLTAALLAIGLAATLAAPAETETETGRAPRPGSAGPNPRVADLAEWGARLALLVVAALALGVALTGDAGPACAALARLGATAFAAGARAALAAPARAVWIELGCAAAGLFLIAGAASPIPGVRTRPGDYLSHALGDPLRDVFARFGARAALILALICVYRLSDFVLNIMTPFYLDLGFSKTQVAEARKVFGVAMSMAGVFAGGVSVVRLGVMRSMVIGAFALPVTNTIFAWLAVQGPDFRSLLVAIGIDNIVSGYAGTCLVAYMSSLTSAGFTLTQYALFSSLYSLPGKLVATQSGRLVEWAARAAGPAGPLEPLTGLLARTPPQAYAQALERSHVEPRALGAGYVAYFLYSGLVGVFGMALAAAVALGERRRRVAAD